MGGRWRRRCIWRGGGGSGPDLLGEAAQGKLICCLNRRAVSGVPSSSNAKAIAPGPASRAPPPLGGARLWVGLGFDGFRVEELHGVDPGRPQRFLPAAVVVCSKRRHSFACSAAYSRLACLCHAPAHGSPARNRPATSQKSKATPHSQNTPPQGRPPVPAVVCGGEVNGQEVPADRRHAEGGAPPAEGALWGGQAGWWGQRPRRGRICKHRSQAVAPAQDAQPRPPACRRRTLVPSNSPKKAAQKPPHTQWEFSTPHRAGPPPPTRARRRPPRRAARAPRRG